MSNVRAPSELWLRVRPVLFWAHLSAGVAAGAVILVMSVTGVALTYERQMIAWSDRGFRSSPPTPGAERLGTAALLERVRAAFPDVEPTGITIAADPRAPIVVAAAPRTLMLDAYTGAWLGDASPKVRRVMSELRAWHRWL